MKAESVTQKEIKVSKDDQTNQVMEPVKHPLEDSWTIWLYTLNKNKWGQNLIDLATFDTVEDYWCLYHHMKSPSELEKGQDYAIFKNGIRPAWEDSANKNGGRWIINFDRRLSELDSYWLLTVLTLIGATLKRRDSVCGAVVNIRNNKNKIGIWITDASNEEAILSVGNEMKRKLGIRARINFHKHDVPINMFII